MKENGLKLQYPPHPQPLSFWRGEFEHSALILLLFKRKLEI
jgi:hypothetical protein